MVEVGTEGTVTTWSWVSNLVPTDSHSTFPHAMALVQLDGADTAMLHAVDAGSPDNIGSGSRVRVRWRDESVGGIRDIVCFEPIEGGDRG
ncbi:MAG: OB-fold domain-containing protein [Microthrixaceae bacterium]